MLECQGDLLSALPTRFVVPLLPADDIVSVDRKLNPVFSVAGESFVMATQLALSVDMGELGQRLGSLAEHECVIGNAIDVLLGDV